MATLQVNSAKMAIGQAEQDPGLPRSASNVLGKIPISPLFNRVAGQVEVPAGQVNFRGSLPCSEFIMFCNLCCTLGRYLGDAAGVQLPYNCIKPCQG